MTQSTESLNQKYKEMSFGELKWDISSWLDSLIKNKDSSFQSEECEEIFEVLVKILENKIKDIDKEIKQIEDKIKSCVLQKNKINKRGIKNLKTHKAELKVDSQINQLYKDKETLQKSIEPKYRDVIALRSKKRKLFDDMFQGIPVKKLPWRFFPKGKWTAEEVIKLFGKYVRHNEIFDEKRLRKIIDNLKPSFCYVSEDGFNRYIAFCFDDKDKVILECPIYGTATYVIKGDWQEITRLPKWEAKELKQVVVIRHNETWFSRLKLNINNCF